ncbi:MAG TPA: hypothetical protein PLE19_01370 [Planctomycetota bacterium]|nr:hypothetical protein [Planctomycetota bacterium]HRR78811.1 hypothetical protein [Planctomycetota bacterium]HRT92882.1 hypothetical protein [Planctomycetota bacterium]
MRLVAAALGAALLVIVILAGTRLYQAIERSRGPEPYVPRPASPAAPKPSPQAPRSPDPTPVPTVEAWRSCPIIPVPKVYTERGQMGELLGSDGAAIVVGAAATEPERYAAERLQALILRRFQRTLPIVSEGDTQARQILLLGQRATNAWLDRLCREKNLDLGPSSPGHDGFILEVLDEPGRQILLIGGSDPRGVLYGQDAFCDLLRPAEGQRVVFPIVSVRDWPSIAWRGRPYPDLRRHALPGVFDAYARARFNFIDLRDAPRPRGQFGFAPGAALNRQEISDVITQAHRRGIFVYGTVSCSQADQEPEKAERTFAELRELGADGFWLDFNDLGAPAGAPTLVERILRFARGLGIEGRCIATTPPIGAYERPATDYARRMAKVPGFDAATWFFTCVPNRPMADAAREVGLKCPGWWHNWPSWDQGFLSKDEGYPYLRTDDRPAYMELRPLSAGWHSPSYDDLRDAAQYTNTVMFWRYFAEEYAAGVMGIWAWHPEKHDWGRTREAVYRYVFGPSMAEAAKEFDDALAELKPYFILPRAMLPGIDWPPRLKDPTTRPQALRLLGQLDALLARLEAGAPDATLIPPARLHECYLEPMRATVQTARLAATLELPDGGYAELERRVGELLVADKTAEAEQTFRAGAEKLAVVTARAAQALTGLLYIQGENSFSSFWQKKLSGSGDVTEGDDATRKKAEEALKASGLRDYAALLGGLGQPPGGPALSERAAADWLRGTQRWCGPWPMGLVASEGAEALAIVYPFGAPGEVYHRFEASISLPVPTFQGRLFLDAFVSSRAIGEPAPRVRLLQLWAGDRLLWEQDAAEPHTGWLSLDITDTARAGERLDLRFRVVNRRGVRRFELNAFLGPVRLRALAPREQK